MMCRISRSVLRASCVAFCVAVSLPVLAATYYVDAENGNDSYDGMSPVAARKTLAKAVELMTEAKDELHLAKGTYLLDSAVKSTVSPLIFIGDDPDRANTVIDGQGKSRGFVLKGTSHVFRNLTFTHCAIDASDTETYHYGAALYLDTEFPASTATTQGRAASVISNCTFVCCSNLVSSGGAICTTGVSARDCRFENNYAKSNASCVFDTHNKATGATLNYTHCDFVMNHADGSDAVFDGYHAQCGTTAVSCNFYTNSAAVNGGVTHAFGVATDCNFFGNTAKKLGGVACNNGRHIGGTYTRCKFIGNSAGTNGGAIQQEKWNLSLVDCLFEDNVAGGQGGAVNQYTSCGAIKVTGCTFRRNVSTGGGGAYYGYTGPLLNCTFEDNFSKASGGAVYVPNLPTGNGGGPAVPMIVTNCTFRRNSVSGLQGSEGQCFCGGALSIGCCEGNIAAWSGIPGLCIPFRDCEFTDNAITNCTEYGNGKSHRYGGALMIGNGSIRLERCAFTNNVCEGTGGAFFGSATGGVERCTFYGNRAGFDKTLLQGSESLNGGAISFERTPTGKVNVVSHSRFERNSVRGTGGSAIFVSQGDLRLENCDFIGNNLSTNRNASFKPYGGAVCLYGIGSPVPGENSTCVTRKRYSMRLEADSCTFLDNEAQGGGGAIAAHLNYQTNGVSPSGWVRNTLFKGNRAIGYKGATGVSAGGGGAVTVGDQALSLENCSFSGNVAEGVGGGLNVIGAAAGVTNCVFYGDVDSSEGETADLALAAPSVAAYCYAGTASPLVAEGAHNIKADTNPYRVDDHCDLAVRSGCGAAAGLRLNWMTPDSLDLGGKPRLAADGSVDMGCYQRWFKPGLLLFVR